MGLTCGSCDHFRPNPYSLTGALCDKKFAHAIVSHAPACDEYKGYGKKTDIHSTTLPPAQPPPPKSYGKELAGQAKICGIGAIVILLAYSIILRHIFSVVGLFGIIIDAIVMFLPLLLAIIGLVQSIRARKHSKFGTGWIIGNGIIVLSYVAILGWILASGQALVL